MNLQKLILVLIKFYRVKYFGKSMFLIVQFKLNKKCNKGCSYCNLWKEKNKEIPLKILKKTVNEIKKECCFIILSGGEPLLRRDRGEIINFIQKQNGIYLVLATNGILIQKRLNVLKKVDMVLINFNNIDQIIDLKEKGSILRENNIYFELNTTISKMNLDTIDEMIDFAKCYNYPIHFDIIDDIPYLDNANKHLLSKKEKIFVLRKLFKRRKDINNNEKIIRLKLRLLKNNEENNSCLVRKYYNYIDSEGRIHPCMFRINEKDYTIFDKHGLKKYKGSIKEFKTDCRNCNCDSMLELDYMLSRSILHKIVLFIKKRID